MELPDIYYQRDEYILPIRKRLLVLYYKYNLIRLHNYDMIYPKVPYDPMNQKHSRDQKILLLYGTFRQGLYKILS